tara:strand:- start:112 stop:357 length:246 start_codon:yes stop_codon:yes gene_type:complete
MRIPGARNKLYSLFDSDSAFLSEKTNENTAIKSALVTIGAKSVWVQIEVKRLCSLRISVNKPRKFEKLLIFSDLCSIINFN